MVKHRSCVTMATLTHETMSPDLATAKSGFIYTCDNGWRLVFADKLVDLVNHLIVGALQLVIVVQSYGQTDATANHH